MTAERTREPLYSVVRVITLTSVLMLTLVSGFLSASFFLFSAQREQHALTTEATQITNYLNAALGPLLWNYDTSTIKAIVHALVLRGDIPYIKILEDGKVVVTEGIASPELPLRTVEVRHKRQVVGSFAFQLEAQSTQVFREGAFSFGLTFFGILLISFGVLLPWMVRRILAVPLKKLQTAAEAYAGGNYSQELLKANPVREFLPVNNAFLILGQRIQRQLDHSKLLNDELENRVRDRTQELTLTNENLEKTVWDLRQTQDYLVQSEKLASLGKLVASIAHELNTPLGAIDSSCRTLNDMISRELMLLLPQFFTFVPGFDAPLLNLLARSIEPSASIKSPPSWKERREWQASLGDQPNSDKLTTLVTDFDLWPLRDDLTSLLSHPNSEVVLALFQLICSIARSAQIISTATEKASIVVRSLRDYAHKEEQDQLQEVSLEKELETVLTLFRGKMKDRVSIERHYEPGVSIQASRSKLNQVWINLVSNALSAMNGEGQLELAIFQKGDFVTVEVTDSGTGIPEELQGRIFEPFFTTKGPSGGMGLGLDICQQIVASQRGTISFESRPGRTTFRVVLPRQAPAG
ncbi:MAG: hypothetical protein HKM05_00210 [Spirochaetales bacterium]|nr:hypothetical protein [Spirochaetales bacterium]